MKKLFKKIGLVLLAATLFFTGSLTTQAAINNKVNLDELYNSYRLFVKTALQDEVDNTEVDEKDVLAEIFCEEYFIEKGKYPYGTIDLNACKAKVIEKNIIQ